MSESVMTGAMSQTPKQDKHILHVFTSKQIFSEEEKSSHPQWTLLFSELQSLTFKPWPWKSELKDLKEKLMF